MYLEIGREPVELGMPLAFGGAFALVGVGIIDGAGVKGVKKDGVQGIAETASLEIVGLPGMASLES